MLLLLKFSDFTIYNGCKKLYGCKFSHGKKDSFTLYIMLNRIMVIKLEK
jgi:hypothetical protein